MQAGRRSLRTRWLERNRVVGVGHYLDRGGRSGGVGTGCQLDSGRVHARREGCARSDHGSQIECLAGLKGEQLRCQNNVIRKIARHLQLDELLDRVVVVNLQRQRRFFAWRQRDCLGNELGGQRHCRRRYCLA